VAVLLSVRPKEETSMRRAILLACLALSPVAARADDSETLKAKMQALMDAVAPGDKTPWAAILDKRFTTTDENGEVYNYDQILEQIAPLPKGSSGTIKVTDWRATIFGDSAVSTELDDEHENFHGQNIHAQYRQTATWLKEAGDWKLVATQTIALRQDPPAVELPAALTDTYVGRYRAGPDYVVEITKKDGRLYSATNGGKPVEIKAEIADVLFTPGAPRSRRLFQHNANGAVTGFLSRREERDVVFTRER
jgi:hypothetical protein